MNICCDPICSRPFERRRPSEYKLIIAATFLFLAVFILAVCSAYHFTRTSAVKFYASLALGCADLAAFAMFIVYKIKNQSELKKQNELKEELIEPDNSNALWKQFYKIYLKLIRQRDHDQKFTKTEPNLENNLSLVEELKTFLSQFNRTALVSESESPKGETLCMALAKIGGPPSILNFLQEKGVNFDARERESGNTALMWSLANARSVMAMELIKVQKKNFATNWNLQDNIFGNTALILAIVKGYYNQSSDGIRLKYSYMIIILELLEAKADVNIADKDGNTALHYAALKRELDLVNLLLYFGANREATNSNGEKPRDFLQKSYKEASLILDSKSSWEAKGHNLFFISSKSTFKNSKNLSQLQVNLQTTELRENEISPFLAFKEYFKNKYTIKAL